MSQELLKVHRNVPQLLFNAVRANANYLIWGRRTGKTEGPICDFTLDRIHEMPRANGFALGTTYTQLLTRTLPPLVAAWEKQGYYRDVHYSIGKFLPKEWRVPRAYRCPLRADTYIHWYNGSGIYLVSQDRPGTINGVSTQWGFGDEAKFLNPERMNEEVLLTLSGLADLFGDKPGYLSTLFCSDMPTSGRGKWLLDAKKQMDPKRIELILTLQAELIRMQQEPAKTRKGQAREAAAAKELQAALDELRRDAVYYSEASTLDNIDVLGLAPIKLFERTLNDIVFRTTVLNQQVNKVEDGFYALLDESTHAYDAYDYTYIDHLDLNFKDEAEQDSRWDADVQLFEPLDIAGDFNHAINSLVVGQEQGREYRFLNALYVEKPLLLGALVKKFVHYYRFHGNKHVNFYYDHTAVGKNASSDLSYADEWVKGLEDAGWTVSRMNIGQASSHHSRYLLWGTSFAGRDPRLPQFRYNRSNCAPLITSMEKARTRQVNGLTGKDKRPERDPNTPPVEATHFSEAADMLWYGRHRQRLHGSQGDFVDNIWE